MSYDFSGKVALVTGSSRGIGAGIIQALNAGGARCIVNFVADPQGRNEEDARKVAETLQDPLVIECNVGEASQVEAMMRRIAEECGGLDILVNNAGILRDRTIKKMTTEEWESVLRVNLTGTFHCIQQAQPFLRPEGRIVSLASVSGQLGLFGQANYAASKAGIIALTKVTAREFARQRITVNAIAPGFIQTEMTRDLPEEVVKKALADVPLGHFGEIADVVNTALFLCSQDARYITGQVLNVNGGFFM
ncbi:short-chain dehydrogenase/reductase SDR [Chthoniobacter flavus Ellin428]|uniref:Short-chain dehydrogenase/reductase SDR n=1 Tax=Chthoniobacter flavus Ellin428 TaxID=497964 RepID=B4DCE7_9BACT|nr:3-oxoacyl-ACP reductase FabG [Chthoniobacter flavus]EDY15896.1 short-chain dehydrogenase/reductase SDR [Chthoniobacter flavus Ellin428]TCO87400.1 3-oxoacyl-[acyl-carrier-protein] reductase /acetoacetyl-CoA reductase [Chthoniobacter flavus]